MTPSTQERRTEERLVIIERTMRKLLADGELWRVTRVLDSLHPADAADLVESLSEEDRGRIYEAWEPGHSAKALQEMGDDEQADLADRLSVRAVAGLLEEMSPDDAADLLADIGSERRGSILHWMSAEKASEALKLLSHGSDTAGGLMTPRTVSLRKEMSVTDAINHLREIGPGAEDVYYVFVVDDDDRLSGVISLRDLVVAQPGTHIKSLMREEVFRATVDTDREEVIRMMRKYNLSALPVIDELGRLSGMVTFDDAFEAFEDEATEDAYRMAGTVEASEGDAMGGRLFASARARIPWIAIALLGETIIVGAIAERFQEFLLFKVPILILFFTAMTNLGGNISTQAATIIVRGFATGQLEVRHLGRRILREARLGLFMGVLIAISMGVVAFLLAKGSVAIGLVVGSAALAVVIGGGLVGTLVPIISHRMGVDPAVTTPLLTVIMDASSLLIYLGVALVLLRIPLGSG